MQVPSEAGGVGFPGAGIRCDCDLPAVDTGNRSCTLHFDRANPLYKYFVNQEGMLIIV